MIDGGIQAFGKVTVGLLFVVLGSVAAQAQDITFPYVQFRNQPDRPLTEFQQGRPEENGVKAATGNLTGRMLLRLTAKSPLVILMAGCSRNEQETSRFWLNLWEAYFWARGYSYLEIDSFTSRGVTETCTSKAYDSWAYRRRDDAYSALIYLSTLDNDKVDMSNVYVMGRDQGGLAALRAVELKMQKARPHLFKGAFAMYPYCGDISPHYYAPTRIFVGSEDDFTPAKDCLDQAKIGKTNLEVTVVDGAYHGFDDNTPRGLINKKRVGQSYSATGVVRDAIAKQLGLPEVIYKK